MPKSELSVEQPGAEPREEGLPHESPDFIEQDHPETLDNIVPTRGYQMMPMVGLGGSAGGIAALQEFFKAMPADSGMVFVVIMHLSPTHESTLADLLSRTTTMQVVQAVNGDPLGRRVLQRALGVESKGMLQPLGNFQAAVG